MSKPKLAWYEDNLDFTDSVEPYLKNYFQVKIFGDPDEAEKDITDFQPDIIIFDYRMRNITGLEMYELLKKKRLQFVAVFYTIWGKDDATVRKILISGISKEAIIDKEISARSISEFIIEYYNKYEN